MRLTFGRTLCSTDSSPQPLIRLASGPANGTAHLGALSGTEAVTVCAAHSPGLRPAPELAAHTPCQSCAGALLALAAAPHPGELAPRPDLDGRRVCADPSAFASPAPMRRRILPASARQRLSVVPPG